MTPERFARLKEVLLTAAALEDGERRAYLDRACGDDDEMRAEVDSLLAHRDVPTGRLQPEAPQGEAVRLPERIGPYRILGILGEGGMGVVYRAEQTEPIHREVALKLARAGADTPGARARLAIERRTLAALEHPGIARVLDAGADEAGRPWFAMEVVRGEPITAYCDARDLDRNARVQLMLEVCRAVRHAHGCGVLHRDLKPSNVLVTEAEGRPVAKVIDFGIAKALEAPALETAFRTRTGQLVGTLEYMSPEQARGDLAAIDARSDVWSLGVMLYELLTGRLPIEVAGVPLHEAVRRIVDDPFRSFAETARTATGRPDADLQTIVAKCLEKDPSRRYRDCAELTEDLERYLTSRPIRARPPSAVYQFRKLVRRHRLGFGAAAAAFVTLILYGATVSWQLRAERRAVSRAETEARKSARVTAFMEEMLAAASPDALGRDATVREALDAASETAGTALETEAEVRTAIETTIGRTYLALQDFSKAESHLLAALREREARLEPGDLEVLEAHHDLARLYAAAERWEEAEREIGLALDTESAAEPPVLARARMLRMKSAVEVGRARLGDAEASIREAVGLHAAAPSDDRAAQIEAVHARYQQAIIQQYLCRWNEALDLASTSAAEYARLLGSEHPSTLEARRLVGDLLWSLKRNDESETTLLGVLEGFRERLGPRSPGAARTLKNLSEVYITTGRRAEAERALREAISIHTETNGERNARTIRERALLAQFFAWGGDADRALPLARSALAQARESLGEDHPTTANAWGSLSDALLGQGDLVGAEDAAVRGWEIAAATWGPDHPWAMSGRHVVGRVRQRRGDLDGAEAILAPLWAMARSPDRTPFPSHAPGLVTLAEVKEEKREFEEAAAIFARAVELADELSATDVAVNAGLGRARCLRAAGHTDEALVAEREALERARATGNESLLARATAEAREAKPAR